MFEYLRQGMFLRFGVTFVQKLFFCLIFGRGRGTVIYLSACILYLGALLCMSLGSANFNILHHGFPKRDHLDNVDHSK